MKSKKEYELVRFGDVVRSVRETERNPLNRGLEICVGIDNIEPENLHIRDWGLVKDGTSFTRVFRKGQVLFVRRRAYQRKVALAEFDGICSGDIIVMEAIADKLIPELLPFIVQSEKFFRYAINTSAGSLSPRTKWKHLAQYQFQLPPIKKQHHIADVLWTLDETIKKYRKLLTALQMFINKQIDNLFSQIQGENVKLIDLSVRKPDHGIYGKIVEYKNDKPRFIRITDINREGVLIDDERVSVEIQKYQDYLLEQGDILFSRTGTVGLSYLYKEADGLCIFIGNLIRFRLNQSKAIPKFIFYFTKSSKYRKWLLSQIKYGVQPSISSSQYSKIKIPLATIDVQNHITREIEKTEREIYHVKNLIYQLEILNHQLIESEI